MGEAPPTWADFVDGFELFQDPILCGVLAGLVLGYLGVFVVLRRTVFVTAAISQSAGLGVALAFYAQIHLGLSIHPVIGAMALSLLATVLLVARTEGAGLSRESVLGVAYLASAAGAVLVGDRISQEAHDVSAILFGSAVLVRRIDLWLVAAVGAVVMAIQLAGRRGFVFASFDPEGARVHGLPVGHLDAVLWVLLALQVSVSTRALGVLPVFAFAVLPAAAALMHARRIGTALVAATLIGGISGGAGYVAAFFGSFPVGASQASVALAFFLVALALRYVLGRFELRAGAARGT